MSNGGDFTLIQPGDLDPAAFVLDPVTGKITIVPGAGSGGIENNSDAIYITSALVSGQHALMFLPGTFVEHADPTMAFIYAGVSLTAAQPGAQVTVRRVGIMQSDTWDWQADMPIMVAPNGVLTQAAPTSGYSKVIGYALQADTIFLAPEHMIHLGG